MDWGILIGIFAGVGTAIGAIAATEDYLSKKFVKAVRAVLTELEIDRKLRHLEKDYQGLAQDYTRSITELEERLERCKDADIRINAQLNATRIHADKLETAIRMLCKDEALIHAIFESTGGLKPND